ncbi:HD-GYP domain, c-di-GMP phosphodiesterase class II (or its inactivated variant) [Caloramator fervidus]|uniref:HD-GYP domain, c-di-GMP phosphodiesterase class II (Or its inactivated variant) n=1 Tax=Caloramator fervidus TaxID=29344 RepID=A0A1H5XQG6_9CLOT|nr:HD-GYP domain-containing protein [Caloramator fervidus]SEG13506.1 HD-GYP domain, c-di-GMP phosphodiesterase class II (or its inactivated variant) [Caloramator fervidus]
MKLCSIFNVKEGDVLAQSIIDSRGNILLREGIVLTKRYINKLMDLGIIYIYVKDKNLFDIKGQDIEFLEIKTYAVKSLNRLYSRIEYYNSADFKDTLQTIIELVDYLIENKEVSFTYLTELKTYDNYTFVHSLNSCVVALFLGVQLSYSKPMLIDLGAGTILHDIGKIKIPHSILNKDGKLTDEEYDIMKTHCELGYDIIKDIKGINEREKSIVLEHHERYDGKGYPKGLSGNKISKFARIACLCDVYDALISDRVYRKAFPPNEAYEFILASSGTYFDPEIVNLFKKHFCVYPLGIEVKLSNGYHAYVVGQNKGFPDRPKVRVFKDDGGVEISPYDINLVEKPSLCIEGIIF